MILEKYVNALKSKLQAMSTTHRLWRTFFLRRVLFLVLFSVVAGQTSKAQDAAPPILPAPQQWTWQGGQMSVGAITQIVLGCGHSEGDRFAARQLQQTLADRYGVEVEIRTEQDGTAPLDGAVLLGAPGSSPLVRQYVQPSALADTMQAEGYVLDVGENVAVIAGAAEAGRFYGAMTLQQLLEAGDQTLRRVTIADYPSMKFRGVSDDLSRGPVSTLENFKKIIRFLAWHKMNVYTPYIEDVLKFEAYPSIGEERGALTKEGGARPARLRGAVARRDHPNLPDAGPLREYSQHGRVRAVRRIPRLGDTEYAKPGSVRVS